MLFRFFFKRWPLQKQICYLVRKGVLIGTRTKDTRKIFVYMYKDLFAEVLFFNDNPNQPIQSGNVVKGLESLNNYLEKEFRTSF